MLETFVFFQSFKGFYFSNAMKRTGVVAPVNACNTGREDATDGPMSAWIALISRMRIEFFEPILT